MTLGESGTALCEITLSSGKGSCTLSAKRLHSGTYQLTATYDGNGALMYSVSNQRTLIVAKATARVGLMVSANKIAYGHEQAERLSVAVSPEYPGTVPTGTVTVSKSTTTLCKIVLRSGKGSCHLSASQLKVGTYRLVATYGGNTDFKVADSSGSDARDGPRAVTDSSRRRLGTERQRCLFASSGHEGLPVSALGEQICLDGCPRAREGPVPLGVRASALATRPPQDAAACARSPDHSGEKRWELASGLAIELPWWLAKLAPRDDVRVPLLLWSISEP